MRHTDIQPQLPTSLPYFKGSATLLITLHYKLHHVKGNELHLVNQKNR